MSAVCTRPSLSTLDISSTWSLRYLLSSTRLPSRCSATWNARLTSWLKPPWNCGLKRCRLSLSSPPPFSQKCRSHKKIPPLRWRLLLLLLSQLENQQFELERHHSSFCLFSSCLQFTSALQANKLNRQTQLLNGWFGQLISCWLGWKKYLGWVYKWLSCFIIFKCGDHIFIT